MICKINEVITSQYECDSILKLLHEAHELFTAEGLTIPSVEQIGENNSITANELDEFFDTDHDGEITASDLYMIKDHLFFATLEGSLRHYHYLLTDRIDLTDVDSLPELFLYNGIFAEAIAKQHKDDPAIILKLIKVSPWVIKFASDEIKNDREFVMEAVKQNPYVLHDLGNYADDKEVVLEAVKQDGQLLYIASDRLRDDRDVVLEAIKKNLKAINYASDSLKNDVEIIAAAVIMYAVDALAFIPEGMESIVWQKCFALLAEQGFNLPSNIKSYKQFVEYMKGMNIDHPERMGSLTTMATVIANREVQIDDQRPIALLIYAKSDWNGALEYRYIDAFVKSNVFRVLYYEAKNEKQVRNIIKKVHKDYGRKIHTLWFGAHGEYDKLLLGPSKYEPSLIDFSDFGPPPKGENFGDLIGSVIDPNGQIVLYSCGSGEGAEDDDNLVNLFAQYVPGGVTIFGMADPYGEEVVFPDTFEIAADGMVSGHFLFGQYVTNGKMSP